MANLRGRKKLNEIKSKAEAYESALLWLSFFDYSNGVKKANDFYDKSQRQVYLDFENERLKLNKLVEDFLKGSSKYQLLPEDFEQLKKYVPALPPQKINEISPPSFDSGLGFMMEEVTVDLVSLMATDACQLLETIAKKQESYKQLDALIEDIIGNLLEKYNKDNTNPNDKRIKKIKDITRELNEISKMEDPCKKANATRGCLLQHKKELGRFDHGTLSKELNLLLKEPALQTGNSTDSDIKIFKETVLSFSDRANPKVLGSEPKPQAVQSSYFDLRKEKNGFFKKFFKSENRALDSDNKHGVEKPEGTPRNIL